MSPAATEPASIAERPLVTVNGQALADALEQNLVDARVELVTNGTGQATLRFYDADFQLLGSSLPIGGAVKISFPMPGTARMLPVFSGEIIVLAAEQGPNDLHELVVTAFDLGHRMSRSVKPTTWVNVTYRDIMMQIASNSGLRARIGEVGNITFKHLLQTTDDRTFLTELAARAGVTWRVDDGTLVVDDTQAPSVAVKWGQELRRFSTRLNAAGPYDTVDVRGWDMRKKQAHVGRPRALSNSLSSNGATAEARKKGYGLRKATKIVAGQITDSADEAEMVATAMRERLDSGLTQARGEILGNPALVPGSTLKVDGMGTNFSGTYRMTTVEHVSTPRGYVTRFHAGPASASTLADILESPASKFHGATVGIVTNNKDPDFKAARVKVKLPMLGDAIETDWARVVTLGAGPSRGLQITPSVNDEVVVIFEGGDVRRPIVLGGVWNGNDEMPMPIDQTVKGADTTIWHLRTKAGHQLTFDESEASKEHVTILLKDGATKLHLGVDTVDLVANNKPLEIKSGGASIKLAGNDITITANNVNIKSNVGLKAEAGATIEVAAKGSATVSGASVDVKGQGMVNVEASGVASVKGAIVKIN